MSADDEEGFGRPSTVTTTENVAKLREAILENRRPTIHDVCNIVGLSYRTCQRILSDELNMRRIAAKFVPSLLSDDQKKYRISICTELKEQAKNDSNIISNTTTGDESWMFVYDAETKQLSSQWKTPTSPRPMKARKNSKQFQINVDFFLTLKASCIRNLFQQDRRWMENYITMFWDDWGENIQRKYPDKWRNNSWVLHHDNAPAHAWLAVRQFLASTNTTVIPQPPCLPDLAPCDFFFLIPEDEIEAQGGRRFENIKEIQTVSQNAMKTLTQKDFQKCFRSWKSRWDPCINDKGDYFEVDGDKEKFR